MHSINSLLCGSVTFLMFTENLRLGKSVMLLRGETGYNTTALIELVQVQGAHGKTTRPLRLMGHLKRLHHISPLSRK